MIYTSAIYANPEHTQVTGTDANGNTETVPHDHTLFRQPDHGPIGFLANGGMIADYVALMPEPDNETVLRQAMFDEFVDRMANNKTAPAEAKAAALALKAKKK